MNKDIYITRLKEKLSGLPQEERDAAIKYYEEYFDDAGVENEQVVLNELGSVEDVANKIIQENSNNEKTIVDSKNISNKINYSSVILVVIIIVFLSPVILPITIAIISILIGIVFSGIGLQIGGLVIVVRGLIGIITTPASGLITLGSGLILFSVGTVITSTIVIVSVKFLPNIFKAMLKFFKNLFKVGGNNNESV